MIYITNDTYFKKGTDFGRIKKHVLKRGVLRVLIELHAFYKKVDFFHRGSTFKFFSRNEPQTFLAHGNVDIFIYGNIRSTFREEIFAGRKFCEFREFWPNSTNFSVNILIKFILVKKVCNVDRLKVSY